MPNLTKFSNVEPCKHGYQVPFVVGDGNKPFFNLNAYPLAFGVYLGCATGAALSYLATLRPEQRGIHVSHPSGSLPSAVDAVAFCDINARLRRMGFIISEKLEAGFLVALRVH